MANANAKIKGSLIKLERTRTTASAASGRSSSTRRGESVGLSWSDVDFKEHTVYVCNSYDDAEGPESTANYRVDYAADAGRSEMEGATSAPIDDTRHRARECERPNKKLVELLYYEHMFVF